MRAEASIVVKRLKILIGILIASNIVVGALSFHFLRKSDADYSELIDRSLPTINHLRGMTSESSLTHRSLTFALGSLQPDRRDSYLNIATQALTHGEKHVTAVAPVLRSELGEPTVARLLTAFDQYQKQSKALVAQLQKGNRAEANVEIRDMRQALDEFMTVVAEISDAFEQRSQDQSDMVSANVQKQGKIMLGLGGWPLGVIAVVALVIAIVLILMLILTHRLGAQEEP